MLVAKTRYSVRMQVYSEMFYLPHSYNSTLLKGASRMSLFVKNGFTVLKKSQGISDDAFTPWNRMSS
jgi:hypothetical protein